MNTIKEASHILTSVEEARQEHAKKYPLHNELKLNEARARVVGDFLDWLDEQAFFICEQRKQDHANYGPIRTSKTDLIGAYLGIDPKALEAEKLKMLEEIRAKNEGK